MGPVLFQVIVFLPPETLTMPDLQVQFVKLPFSKSRLGGQSPVCAKTEQVEISEITTPQKNRKQQIIMNQIFIKFIKKNDFTNRMPADQNHVIN
jgi:hypothetical protein